MTALNIATDIPTNINSVEKLSVWCGNVLHTLYPEVSVAEGDNYTQRAAQSNPYYIASANLHRNVARQSIELDPNFAIGASKPWSYAKDLGTKTLTADMKAN
jgi:hypothetical protein